MASKNQIKIGASLKIDLTRTTTNEAGATVPVSLTGVEVTSALKHPKFGVFPFEVEVISAPLGQVRLVLEAAQTLRMLPGEYTWDIVFADNNDNVEIFPKDNKVIFEFIKGSTV